MYLCLVISSCKSSGSNAVLLPFLFFTSHGLVWGRAGLHSRHGHRGYTDGEALWQEGGSDALRNSQEHLEKVLSPSGPHTR